MEYCKKKLELIFPIVEIREYLNEQQDVVWSIKCINHNGKECNTIQKFYNQWDSEYYKNYLIMEIIDRLIKDLIKL